MRSIIAVGTQFTNSACNYGVFIYFSRSLDKASFVAFSTAVGLNLFAFAIAESGVSYIAPREVADRSKHEATKLATAFLTISAFIYVAALGVGFIVWNLLAADRLDFSWVLSYGLFFFPTVLVPAWFVNRSIRLSRMIWYVIARMVLLAALILWFDAIGLVTVGILGLIFTLFWILSLGTDRRAVSPITRADLKYALSRLRSVMLAKGFSYTVYGSIPMLVGIAAGNSAAALYVTGERLKALYASIFQPIVIATYIRVCELEIAISLSRRITAMLIILNIAVFSTVFFNLEALCTFLFYDKLEANSGRAFFLVASAISVCSTVMLHFRVFLYQAYKVFARAVTIQSLVFIVGCTMLFLVDDMPAWSLPIVGETVLLVSLLVIHKRHLAKQACLSGR